MTKAQTPKPKAEKKTAKGKHFKRAEDLQK